MSGSNKVEEAEDFLENDQPIPGQNYVCMSFISPENIIKRRELFFCKKFMQWVLNDPIRRERLSDPSANITYNTIDDMFEDWKVVGEQAAQDEFNKMVDFQTNVRGVKIRGVYESLKEAQIRARVLQKRDPNFHIYVGQVGFWLPWEPTPDRVQEQEYSEQSLNTLMKKYRENKGARDELYEENKQRSIKKAEEENARRKEQLRQENMAKATVSPVSDANQNTAANSAANSAADSAASSTVNTVANAAANTVANAVDAKEKIKELREIADERDALMMKKMDKTEKTEEEVIFSEDDPWMQSRNRNNNKTDVNVSEVSKNIF